MTAPEGNPSIKHLAREFAIRHHGGQRYGIHPYHVHLDAVAEIASSHGETAEVIAYLHDVVEDTAATLEELEEEFGALVALAVGILTDQPGQNRKDRKDKTYARMRSVSGKGEIALVVKAADRLANTRACLADNNTSLLSMYRREHAQFKQSVYRPGLCEEIWLELDAMVNA